MAKVAVNIQFLVLCSIVVIAMPVVHSISEGPKEVEEWFQKLSHAKEKVTKLHYYFHDTGSGKHPTVVTVAQSNTTSSSPTSFGLINIIDDPLTVGPEPTSKIVGRAQGFYGSADLEEVGLLMAMNLVFTSGKHNGSTLSLLGRNPPFHTYRELSIVGGSGLFRLARGIATAKTYSFNTTTLDAVVEYSVIVIHY